ncbi:ParB/RepB/Spo0J family partition protein [Streptomyces sp. H27-C3]|uniref:ParB/RepB/Spo0J family partition protein n=1 Tax=Streptomyces sp. H27-C3 TaxID=3046305 RepID=UPI0024B9FB01|nr:ParB/RepB/Spo0J family partition protein [Streptomyces sp. H27-C3]MDJ0466971.1 ParB/RepB/Spo0J family partition protein [Streptomyces sp. H27-C3]
MSRVADELGTGTSFGNARPVSARRAATAAATGTATAGVPDPTELPLAQISQNPDNPRDHLRNLDDLTNSVRELGVINSITVSRVEAYLRERPTRANELDEGARYLVVDGHRRLEAARRAGHTTIKVTINDALVATDETLLESAFVTNFHRDDMTELEEAHALEALVKHYGSQSKASKRLGMPQSTISSKLSFLKLSPELQADLANGEVKVEHVRNLGKLPAEEQRAQAQARAEAEEARRRAAKADRKQVTSGAEAEQENHGVIDGHGGGEPTPDTKSAAAEDAQPGAAKHTQAVVKTAEAGVPDPRKAPHSAEAEDGRHDVPWEDEVALGHMLIERVDPAVLSKLIGFLLNARKSPDA